MTASVTGLGRRCAAHPRISLTIWALVLAVLAGATVMFWNDDRRHTATDRARAAAIKSAESEVVEVLSYDHRTMDDDLTRARERLTGKFRDDFSKLTQELVAPTAKQDGISTKAQIQFSGVVEASPDEVVTLLFVSQTTTSSKLKQPKVDGSRIQVTMKRNGGRWLISDLKPL